LYKCSIEERHPPLRQYLVLVAQPKIQNIILEKKIKIIDLSV
jgi:hypothetical protein